MGGSAKRGRCVAPSATQSHPFPRGRTSSHQPSTTRVGPFGSNPSSVGPSASPIFMGVPDFLNPFSPAAPAGAKSALSFLPFPRVLYPRFLSSLFNASSFSRDLLLPVSPSLLPHKRESSPFPVSERAGPGRPACGPLPRRPARLPRRATGSRGPRDGLGEDRAAQGLDIELGERAELEVVRPLLQVRLPPQRPPPRVGPLRRDPLRHVLRPERVPPQGLVLLRLDHLGLPEVASARGDRGPGGVGARFKPPPLTGKSWSARGRAAEGRIRTPTPAADHGRESPLSPPRSGPIPAPETCPRPAPATAHPPPSSKRRRLRAGTGRRLVRGSCE